VRLVLLGVVAVAAWLLFRRRARDDLRVVVGWEDGSELELRRGSPEREALVTIARQVVP
jgi:hypothetical protein